MPVHKSVKLNTKLYMKAADTTRNNTNTYADDPDLVIPVNANQNLFIVMSLSISASTEGDFKHQITIPAGGSLTRRSASFPEVAVGTVVVDATAAVSVNTTTGTTYRWEQFLRYIGGANGGNITLQWAQNTKHASDCTLKEGSCFIVFM